MTEQTQADSDQIKIDRDSLVFNQKIENRPKIKIKKLRLKNTSKNGNKISV